MNGSPSPPTRSARHAAGVDRDGRFPQEALAALRDARLLALGVPPALGGPGGGARELAAAVEQVAAACGSTAMVYTMHLVATRTLLATAPAEGPLAETLRAIAAGEHLTTIAFSERGSRSHFWAQTSRARAVPGGVRIDAEKSFVTAAEHADSYVVATGAPGTGDPLATELYLVPADAPGIEVLGPFDGLGMRGNGSSPVRFRDVFVPAKRRLGEPGGGFVAMLTATLPWFVLGCAACCVGLSGRALELAAGHAAATRLEHEGVTLAELATIRARLGQAKVRHQAARAFLGEVVAGLDAGEPDQVGILGLKAACAEAAIEITDAAMRVCGGAAYSRRLPLERIFRDARAAAVMGPTTDVLLDLLGRSLTGQRLF